MNKYYRKIKSKNNCKATFPVKNKREMNLLINYWKKEYEYAKTESKKNKAYRNYLLILCGFNLAFRAEDLLQLIVLRIKKGYMTIKENKTGKIQNFRLNKEFHKELLKYIETFHLSDYDYLFFSKKPGDSEPITRQGADKNLKKAAKSINLKQDFSMHSLRKTFAYQKYISGTSILTLMKMLNHDNPITTLIYICWDQYDAESERTNTYYSGL